MPDIKQLAKQIIHKVHADAPVGPSNKLSSDEKSGGWAKTLLNYHRKLHIPLTWRNNIYEGHTQQFLKMKAVENARILDSNLEGKETKPIQYGDLYRDLTPEEEQELKVRASVIKPEDDEKRVWAALDSGYSIDLEDKVEGFSQDEVSIVNRAVYAIADGAANCGANASLAMMELCRYIMVAKEKGLLTDDDTFESKYIATPVPEGVTTQEEAEKLIIDHGLVKITINSQSVICDPWLDFVAPCDEKGRERLRYLISVEEDKAIPQSSERWQKLEVLLLDDTPESKQCVSIKSFSDAERFLKLYQSQSEKYAALVEEIDKTEQRYSTKAGQYVEPQTRQKDRAQKIFGDSVKSHEKYSDDPVKEKLKPKN